MDREMDQANEVTPDLERLQSYLRELLQILRLNLIAIMALVCLRQCRLSAFQIVVNAD